MNAGTIAFQSSDIVTKTANIKCNAIILFASWFLWKSIDRNKSQLWTAYKQNTKYFILESKCKKKL